MLNLRIHRMICLIKLCSILLHSRIVAHQHSLATRSGAMVTSVALLCQSGTAGVRYSPMPVCIGTLACAANGTQAASVMIMVEQEEIGRLRHDVVVDADNHEA
eukprot:TRINITY_DN70700_c0_g1_i1.p1 TRINITY_DN70700_c0_g1~~TRINITY_DN70700_c0_g1_i1.p1  ORF type:complete len:103 (-),score=12.24 TRINITY_DN70700_c0_g1_i1:8-316(-)